MAHFISIGDAAHGSERQALHFLKEGLPNSHTIFANAWLTERSGVVYELDAVVVAPHAIFVVEIKGYRGRIEGTDHDWYIPHPIKSPLKLNRKTAQVLNDRLRRSSYRAGQVWVQGLVFLSSTNDLKVRGDESRDRVHTRKTILEAISDPAWVERLSNRRSPLPSEAAESELTRLLTGSQRGPRPSRRIREYDIVEALDRQDTFTELLGTHRISGARRVLRIYSAPPLATDEQRERVAQRARWESQVLGRLGRSPGILSADPPFDDEAGIVLPLEHFEGVTLTTWLERYGPAAAKGKRRADLKARIDLWLRLARTADDAHQQGVIHRLLRPEVILVQDDPNPTALRITGFDLAKQVAMDSTIHVTSIADDRLVYAAPEVLQAFSSAEPASDQFSLGALLALILAGRPLFDSTRELLAARRLLRRVCDMAPRIPLTLDAAATRMVALRTTDRFPTLAEAIQEVERGRIHSATH